MDHISLLLPWVTLALLGAFHGLNPAMGWLFAVSLGFQEQRTGAVVKALGPIALGHLLAIAAIAIPVGLLQVVLPERAVMVMGGLILLGYAAYKVITRFRHPRWVGMRVTSLELVSWSALMAAAHGAGLMLIPALAGLSRDEPSAAMASPMPAGACSSYADGDRERRRFARARRGVGRGFVAHDGDAAGHGPDRHRGLSLGRRWHSAARLVQSRSCLDRDYGGGRHHLGSPTCRLPLSAARL